MFAISIGAIPYLCKDILAHRPEWREMVAKVTTVQTQTMQLWMRRTTPELGWDIPFKKPHDTVIGATYLNPLDGQVDFTHLLKWENWPAADRPKSLCISQAPWRTMKPRHRLPTPTTHAGNSRASRRNACNTFRPARGRCCPRPRPMRCRHRAIR